MTLAEPQLKQWTRQEFHRLGETGCFSGKRAVLLNGEIFEMAAQGNWHAVAIGLAEEVLRPILPASTWLRIQMPLDGPNEQSDPEPDLALVEGRPSDYSAHPTTARFVVEVADSSLRLDRRKADAYAAMGVPEYWIINLVGRVLEVYREPERDPASLFGWRYGESNTLADTDSVSPPWAPSASVPIGALFPARPAGDTF